MSMKRINQLIERGKKENDARISLKCLDEALDQLETNRVEQSVAENTRFRYEQYIYRHKLALLEELGDDVDDRIAACQLRIVPREKTEEFRRYSFLAPYYRKKNESRKSIRMYKKLVLLNPSKAGFYFNQIMCVCYSNKDYMGALTYAKYAMINAMEAGDGVDRQKSIINFGVIYRKMKRKDLSNLFFSRALHDHMTVLNKEKKNKKSDFLEQFPYLKEEEIQLRIVQTPLKEVPLSVQMISFFVKNVVPLCNPGTINSLQAFFTRPFGTKRVRIDFTKMTYRDRLGRVSKCGINVYRPRHFAKNQRGRTLPIMIFYHGGGYCVGHPNQIDHYFKKLLEEMDMVIFALDYRKAPKHPLPAGIWDSYAMLRWVRDNGPDWGGDITKVTVSGESAGGHMTILASHFLRDGQYELFGKDELLMVPIYPSVEGTFTSCVELKDAIFVSEKMVRFFVGLAKPDYSVVLGNEKENGIPILLHSTKNLPSTVVVVAEYCLLQLEGEIYYEEIKKSNPDTKMELLFMDKEVHGYITPQLACNKESIPKTVRGVVRNMRERFGIGEEEEVEGEDEEEEIENV